MFFLSAAYLPRTRFYNTIQHGSSVAQADVTSANIVGFQNVSIDNGYAFFTVTFDDVADAETVKLSQLKCLRPDGQGWLRSGFGPAAANACAGAIYIQKISSTGAYGQEYRYYGKNAGQTVEGWYIGDALDDNSNLVTPDNEITFVPGEGMIVYCGKAGALFLTSGSVRLSPTTVDVGNGYSFGGNCNPVELKLSTVKCLRPDGEGWLRSGFGPAAANACAGAIYIQKISSTGAYGQEYRYYGKNVGQTVEGWYVGDALDDNSNLVTSDNEITFAPGEGWILYCGKAGAKIIVPEAVK